MGHCILEMLYLRFLVKVVPLHLGIFGFYTSISIICFLLCSPMINSRNSSCFCSNARTSISLGSSSVRVPVGVPRPGSGMVCTVLPRRSESPGARSFASGVGGGCCCCCGGWLWGGTCVEACCMASGWTCRRTGAIGSRVCREGGRELNTRSCWIRDWDCWPRWPRWSGV